MTRCAAREAGARREQPYRVAREHWWQYAEQRPAWLYQAIAGLDRVIVITLVSKIVMPVMVPTGQVFAHKLVVFATDDTAMLALLVERAALLVGCEPKLNDEDGSSITRLRMSSRPSRCRS